MSFFNDLVFQEMFAAVPEAKQLVPVAERQKQPKQKSYPNKGPRPAADAPPSGPPKPASKFPQGEQDRKRSSPNPQPAGRRDRPPHASKDVPAPPAGDSAGIRSRKRAAPEPSRSEAAPPGDPEDEEGGEDAGAELQVVGTKASQKRLKIPGAAAAAVVPRPPKPVLSASGRPVLSGQTFEDLGGGGELLNPFLVRQLTQFMGYTHATVVQTLAIPACLQGGDVLIRSETGSGKTLAYLIPLIQQLQAIRPEVDRADGTRALILLPTRELCIQVQAVVQKLAIPFHWLVSGVCMGGEKKKAEKERLRRGCPILVASPGRLLDHMRNTAAFRLDCLRMIVFDEADRLLDLGFEEDITAIVKIASARSREPRIQKILASATLRNRGVNRLVRGLLEDPTPVGFDEAEARRLLLPDPEGGEDAPGAGDTEDSLEAMIHRIPENLRQEFIVVPEKHRLPTLVGFLRGCVEFARAKQRRKRDAARANQKPSAPPGVIDLDDADQLETPKAIVFCNTTLSVEFHHALLKRLRWPPTEHEVERLGQLRAELKQRKWKELRDRRRQRSATKGKIHGAGRDGEIDDSDDGDNLGTEGSENEDDGDTGEEHSVLAVDIPIWKLHGNMNQLARRQAFQGFARGGAGVLVCTDVAARGLDLPAVDLVLQLDPPEQLADYVHRIGRTARMGTKGSAVLFLFPHQSGYLEVLSQAGLGDLSPIPAPRVLETLASGLSDPEVLRSALRKFTGGSIKNEAYQGGDKPGTLLLRLAELLVASDPEFRHLAIEAYQSHISAYTTYPKPLKHLFHAKLLHLGQTAASFGLSEPPSRFSIDVNPGAKGSKKSSGGLGGRSGPDRAKSRAEAAMEARSFEH